MKQFNLSIENFAKVRTYGFNNNDVEAFKAEVQDTRSIETLRQSTLTLYEQRNALLVEKENVRINTGTMLLLIAELQTLLKAFETKHLVQKIFAVGQFILNVGKILTKLNNITANITTQAVMLQTSQE